MIDDLEQNPLLGTDLGDGLRKVRMKITSKGKGKSGGARVITFTLVVSQQDAVLNLLYIYDKADRASISEKEIEQLLKQNGFTDSSVSVLHMFIGDIQGTIGETSALAILIGAAILLVFKVIDLKIPLTYIGSFAVFVILYMLGTGKGFDVNYLFSHIFGGGLMLGAWFMATDYVTTPITPRGQYVYGVCLGVLTAVFRLFGGSAEGVSYAIIFCNLLVPMIERVTRHPAFGKGGKKA